jgi:hypothetical protein
MAIPTSAHLAAFGGLTFYYASNELGLKIAISGILQTDLADVLIVTEPLQSLQLRNVTKAIAKHRLRPDLAEQLCQIVGDLGAFGPLRNSIAHNQWVDGAREGSIKPKYVSIREGRADWKGDDPEDRDWTAAEMTAEVGKLAKLQIRLNNFLNSSGLAAIVEEKTA